MAGPHFFADYSSAAEVAAVVAVSVYRLAIQRFRFLAGHLAVFVTHEFHPLPI